MTRVAPARPVCPPWRLGSHNGPARRPVPPPPSRPASRLHRRPAARSPTTAADQPPDRPPSRPGARPLTATAAAAAASARAAGACVLAGRGRDGGRGRGRDGATLRARGGRVDGQQSCGVVRRGVVLCRVAVRGRAAAAVTRGVPGFYALSPRRYDATDR